MSSRWRVIDLVEFSGEVKARSGRIIAAGQEFPLADVGCVLIGERTRWTGDLMSLLADMDVVLLACDWRGIPLSATFAWSEHSRVGARHQAQAAMSRPRMKNAWMRVIRAKIQGQANNLPPSDSRTRLRNLAQQVRSGDPDNLEARAARTYWSKMFPGEDFHRDPLGDGRNSLLNYGYAVLRGMTLRSICAAGLNPTLGIFHRNRANAFALADDLMEPFRPAVDNAVGGMLASVTLADREVKRYLVDVLQRPLRVSGSTVLTAMSELAQRFAIYAEGETDRLEVAAWVPASG